MFNNIINENKLLMENIYNLYKKKMNKIFIGRASIKILDNVLINYNNINVNLNKISYITIIDYNTIKIKLFDISLINIVKNAIIKLKLNLNVFILNKNIFVNLPQINENRRKELIKIVRFESENSRIFIRQIRRNSNFKIKNLYKNKIINVDEKKKIEEKIQEKTDILIRKINLNLIKKEKELFKI
ncbi:MAG: ribosome recycling factor [Enterobacteriaceae bacterium PSpicST1]|nr:MAG: ribosome recycling factor [Enterobacteriaceae bacterium PSpicST1]